MMRHVVRGVLIALFWVILLQGHLVYGQTVSRQADGGETTGESALIEVSIDSGLLTLRASEAPLADVLREIAAQAGIEVALNGEFEHPVTQSFSGVAVEQGLKRLIGDVAFIMIYGPDHSGGGPPPLVGLRVYELVAVEATVIDKRNDELATDMSRSAVIARRSVMLGLGPAPEYDEGLHKDIASLDRDQRLYAMQWLADEGDQAAVWALGRFLALDEDPLVRGEAALALKDIGGAEAADALELGLGDIDPDVRFQVVDALSGMGGFEATLKLGQVIFGDSDPEVRITALAGLGSEKSEAAQAFLEAAVEDSDERVREVAEFILVDW